MPSQSVGPPPPRRIGTFSSMPVAIILAMSRRQKRDALAHQLERALLGADFFGPGFEFIGAGDKRAEVETEGQLNVASPAFASVALAVGAVAADHQAAIDQRRQMSPQRRRRHAMRPQRELLV